MPSLEFDGVYFNDSSGRGDNIYLRFYENGGAVFVILTDNPDPRHVFPHLTGSNQKAYKGNYRITEDNICVTVSYGDVSIKLNGKLSKGKGFDVDIVFVRAGTAVDKSVNIWLAYAQQIYLDHNLSHEMLKTFLDPSYITVDDIEKFVDQLRDYGSRVRQNLLQHWIDAIKTDHLDGLIGLVNMGREDAILTMLKRLGTSTIYILCYEHQGEKIALNYDGPILNVFTNPMHAVSWLVLNQKDTTAKIDYLEHPMKELFTSNAIGPSPWHVHLNPGLAPFDLRLGPLLVDTVYNFAFHGMAELGGQRLS